MTTEFEHDEYMLMAMYQKEDRGQTIGAIHNILPPAAGDREMLALAVSTLEKLEGILDAEFDSLDLEPYKTGHWREDNGQGQICRLPAETDAGIQADTFPAL